MTFSSVHKFLTALPLIYSILCVAFGNNFYRISVAGITSAEIIALLTIFYSLVTKRLFRFLDKRIVFFIALSFLYFFYSILSERELYFIFRQFAFVLYIIYVFALASIIDKNFLCRKINISAAFLFLALIISIFSKGANIDGGVIVLLILFTLGMKFFTFTALLLSVLVVWLSNHAGHSASVFLFFIGSLLLLSKKLIGPSLMIAGAVFVLAIPFVLELRELNDANASWRYLFWKDAILLNIESSAGFLGQGFGVPYINPKFDNFELLINQILWIDDGTYEMFTTPTHNSLITMYYHLGLLGLLVYLLFYFDLILIGVFKKRYKSSLCLVCALLIIISHNALELPYMAIPIACLLAIVHSEIGRHHAYSNNS